MTVDAIVEATAQLLRSEGYDTSLRRIADRAGVSVGSIYQYFPSKEALLTAVMTRHLEEAATILVEAAAATNDQPLAVRVRAVVRGVVDAHLADPALHRVLVSESPRVGSLDLHRHTLEQSTELVAALLRLHANEVRDADPQPMARILVASVDAAVHALVLDHDDTPVEVAVDELTHLVLAYLSPASADRK
jgi:AcrR family transcriptional regulator